MEDKAKEILSKHDCYFLKMISECKVLWKNKNDIIRENDIAVLSNMTEEAWNYFKHN